MVNSCTHDSSMMSMYFFLLADFLILNSNKLLQHSFTTPDENVVSKKYLWLLNVIYFLCSTKKNFILSNLLREEFYFPILKHNQHCNALGWYFILSNVLNKNKHRLSSLLHGDKITSKLSNSPIIICRKKVHSGIV